MENDSSGRDAAHAQAEQALRGLLLAGLDGDAQAYRRFLQQLGTRLRSFFRRRLSGWPDDVEDLVQDTLLAIHNQRHTYRPDQPVTAWVHAIARNLYRSHSRSWAHRLQRASVDAEQVPLHLEGARDAEAHAIAHQRARALHDAISELGEGPRRALLLRAQGHGKWVSIADGQVDIRQAAVKSSGPGIIHPLSGFDHAAGKPDHVFRLTLIR